MTNSIESKERQEKAIFFNKMVLEGMKGIRIKTLMLAQGLHEIEKGEYYKEMNFETFDHYCIDNDLMPSTARKYIRTFEILCVQHKIKIEKIKDIEFSKLELIKGTKKPEDWIEESKVLKYKDLRKNILEKDKGVKIKDDEIENYIKKKKSSCPQWNPDIKKCQKGIDVNKK